MGLLAIPALVGVAQTLPATWLWPSSAVEDEIVKVPAERLEELLARPDQNLPRAEDESSWSAVAQFSYGGKVVSEQPVGQFLWYIHFDAIHHRGQLSAYLRPMGGTVPAIYGPSADSRST